ncbi:uncharacterized protein LOC141673355 [Apium graveolens]|uniref:uncharacterized protein LOC141673355 n=1 Tax=Apium graveolens TaxID=4045 RepID=UPI003D78EAA9
MDRSKIRCCNYDELGHFAPKYRKPKKVKKYKAYLELEAKYEALMRKQQGKAYIAERKSWDETDDEDDAEEYENYALMVLEEGESSASKSENKSCANIAIGLDYDAGASQKKSKTDKGKESVNKEVPDVLKKDVTLVAGLEVNLLSVSQFTDKGFKVIFEKENCSITSKKTGKVVLKGVRKGSLFVADMNSTNKDKICCFYTKASSEQSKLWHKKLSHLNYKAINTLVKRELVKDMPTFEFA